MDGLIVAEKVVKSFGLRPILRGLTFSIQRGASVALLGTNGSGKTTLIRMLAALSRPTAGKILIGGWALPGEAAAVRGQVGVVGHLPLLYDDLTALENLRLYASLYNVDDSVARIQTALERVGLGAKGREMVRTFSRGMQQRLAIARATIHDPAILLLDEPYTGLDVNGVKMLDGFIADWRAAGRTIIMSSHDLDRVAEFTDHVLIISRGQLVVDRPAAEIDALPALFASVSQA